MPKLSVWTFRGEGIAKAMWRRGSEDSGNAETFLEVETRPGALALRGVCFALGDTGGKWGAESRRGFAALRVLGLMVASCRGASPLGDVLFGGGVKSKSTLVVVVGGKKMERADFRGCWGFPSITRDFVNWMHNESRSMTDVGR